MIKMTYRSMHSILEGFVHDDESRRKKKWNSALPKEIVRWLVDINDIEEYYLADYIRRKYNAGNIVSISINMECPNFKPEEKDINLSLLTISATYYTVVTEKDGVQEVARISNPILIVLLKQIGDKLKIVDYYNKTNNRLLSRRFISVKVDLRDNDEDYLASMFVCFWHKNEIEAVSCYLDHNMKIKMREPDHKTLRRCNIDREQLSEELIFRYKKAHSINNTK